MRLGIRIFLVYFLFVGLSGYFLLSTVREQIRPVVRQSSEETLVDTANLLAEILHDDVKAGTLSQSRLPQVLASYGERRPGAQIWGLAKNQISHRIYVTDAQGTVLLDSSGQDVGKDYSRWNDVYLTLRGQYGARSTRSDPADETTSVMHVAAPILDQGRIIGVVTVAKPNSSLQPYIDRAEQRLLNLGLGLIGLGLLVGAALSWWLARSLRRLTRYAQAVSEGQRAALPHYKGGELGQLATAVERMRTQLEGKAYVERYVHTLTHELKSPLAAIRGASELLQGDMPQDLRMRFASNIERESGRLQQMIERLLNLARVEQMQALEDEQYVALAALIDELLLSHAARIEGASLQVRQRVPVELRLLCDPFLMRQALANLLDNALDFSPAGGALLFELERDGGRVALSVFNQGEPIPDYAIGRVSERFYSLPRPGSGRKSTGLGLNFVAEVMQLHGGALAVENVEGGVRVRLWLPARRVN
ncbi:MULTISPECIES: two-component system sensor histidine kinase CreC [Pseudomonas]|uniref:two-component system sensor histidine kinase CreC n=1 Tax=Pseudomonas TaxID=286 RepID=UPI0015DC998B|nr:two-component system sensor histidine kinase CreC [Pseudomonas putida]CAB5519916.1 Sensor protein CreC [Pseudomonas putida]CAB5521552.1 Sensor protein CreC [Pseudomonas putida]CAB5554365.1 Sensor protein CreC [Pseudomonas putida]CAB5554541.1 Sensor protein CreC [Pseudomonas putida]CAB5643978.1 Sensor protein CreC [Pseudomonas putida]